MESRKTDSTKYVYGQVAAKGVAWATMAMIVGKLASFGSQFVLGWYLSKKDFKLWALAISLGAVVAALRDGGTHRILVQQCERYTQLARPVFWIALGFNLLAAAIFIACAPVSAAYYNEPQLVPLMFLIALFMPLSTPVNVLRAKLSSQLRFRELARLDTISMLVRHGSAVALALLGFGAYSFVLPMLIVAATDQLILRRTVGGIPHGLSLTRDVLGEILSASKWVMLATPFMVLIYNGDYLVVGASPLSNVLAEYSYAFQLTLSIAVLFNSGLIGVIMPTLARISAEPGRQAAAYIRAVRLLCFVASPVCIGLAVVANPLLKSLYWNGKWDAAIPVTEITSLVLLPLLLSTLASSLIEAQGKWWMQATLVAIHATCTLAAAYFGSRSGNNLVSLTLCVACQHAVNGIVQGLIAARLSKANGKQYFAAILPSYAISLACAGVVYFLAMPRLLTFSFGIQFLVGGSAFVLLVFLANVILQKPMFAELMELFWRRKLGP